MIMVDDKFNNEVKQMVIDCCDQIKYCPKEVRIEGHIHKFNLSYDLRIFIDQERLYLLIPDAYFLHLEYLACVLKNHIIETAKEAKSKFLIECLAGLK